MANFIPEGAGVFGRSAGEQLQLSCILQRQDSTVQTPDGDPESDLALSIPERAERFHSAHPWVFDQLKDLAMMLQGRGHKRYGIGGLFEVLRWHRAMQIDTEETFKLCNDYRAWYARHLMQTVPELAGFFSLRSSVCDEVGV